MSQQIKSLVERHVPAAYRGTREVQRAVDGIVRDLDAQRSSIARRVQDAARRKGVSEQEVNDFLIGCGLVDRPAPQPTPSASEGDGSLTAAVRSLEQTINGLATFARRHGYRG